MPLNYESREVESCQFWWIDMGLLFKKKICTVVRQVGLRHSRICKFTVVARSCYNSLTLVVYPARFSHEVKFHKLHPLLFGLPLVPFCTFPSCRRLCRTWGIHKVPFVVSWAFFLVVSVWGDLLWRHLQYVANIRISLYRLYLVAYCIRISGRSFVL